MAATLDRHRDDYDPGDYDDIPGPPDARELAEVSDWPVVPPRAGDPF